MGIKAVKENFKKFNNEVQNFARTKPIIALVTAVAMTTLAVFVAQYSLIISLTVFSVAMFFNIAILKNLKAVHEKIDSNFRKIFCGNSKEKGLGEGRYLHSKIKGVVDRAIGFFQGLFGRAKEEAKA